jgi:hypothetical protein
VSGSKVACNEDFSDPICALCKSGGDLVSECPLLTLTPRVHYLLTCVHWKFPSVTALLLDLVIDCLAQLLHPHPLQYTVLPVCYPH